MADEWTFTLLYVLPPFHFFFDIFFNSFDAPSFVCQHSSGLLVQDQYHGQCLVSQNLPPLSSHGCIPSYSYVTISNLSIVIQNLPGPFAVVMLTLVN